MFLSYKEADSNSLKIEKMEKASGGVRAIQAFRALRYPEHLMPFVRHGSSA